MDGFARAIGESTDTVNRDIYRLRLGNLRGMMIKALTFYTLVFDVKKGPGAMLRSTTAQTDEIIFNPDLRVAETWDIPSNASNFAELIKETSGIDLNICYQCRKCHSGCPMAYAMDYSPVQLLHAARLGLSELVLGSQTIWLCAACETCVTRCPQEIDLVKLMDAMRRQALQSKVKIALPEVAWFYRASLLNIRMFGRMYELGLIGHLKLATMNITRDLRLGMVMLKKHKLSLLPDLKRIGEANRIFSRVAKLERSK